MVILPQRADDLNLTLEKETKTDRLPDASSLAKKKQLAKANIGLKTVARKKK